MTSSARPLLNRRLAEFGTTIFAEMSALAVRTGAINLGPGLPRHRRPEEVARGRRRARCATGAATSTRRARASPSCAPRSPSTSSGSTASSYDPDTEVLVTAGRHRGDRRGDARAGASPATRSSPSSPTTTPTPPASPWPAAPRVPVTLRAADDFRLDLDELRAAVTPRTRLLLLNTPHNPTGTVLTRDGARRDRRAGRRARPAGGHRRGLRAPGLRRRAHAAGDVPRHARADGHASPRPARRSPSPAGRSAGSPRPRSWSPRCARPSSS